MSLKTNKQTTTVGPVSPKLAEKLMKESKELLRNCLDNFSSVLHLSGVRLWLGFVRLYCRRRPVYIHQRSVPTRSNMHNTNVSS